LPGYYYFNTPALGRRHQSFGRVNAEIISAHRLLPTQKSLTKTELLPTQKSLTKTELLPTQKSSTQPSSTADAEIVSAPKLL
jgi:hypothetical protein